MTPRTAPAKAREKAKPMTWWAWRDRRTGDWGAVVWNDGRIPPDDHVAEMSRDGYELVRLSVTVEAVEKPRTPARGGKE